MSSTKTLSNAQVPLELKLEEIPELAASRGRSPAELKSSQPTLVGPSLVAPCSDDEEHPDKWNVVFADDGTDFRFRVRPHRKWIWVAAMLAIVVAASSGLAWKSLSARRLAKSDRFSEIAAGQPNIPPTLPRMPTITETAETREEPSVPLDPGFSDRGLEMQVSAPSESNAEYLEDFETLLSGSVGDVEAYCKLLNDWANQLPDSRVLEDFRLVLAEDPPAMMPLERCAAMLDRWATFNVREMSADEVRRNLAEAEQLLTEFPELDAAEVIRERCKVLRAIANRFDEAGNSICAEILRDLEHPAFALPFVLQTKDGKRFYLTKRPEMKGNALPCEYLVNL
ncbi:MAG: hypothetical protein ABI614_09250, partial [Planctomycetota bacterium]